MGTIAGCLCQMDLLPVSLPVWADALEQPRCLDRGECIIMHQVQMGKKTKRVLLFPVSSERSVWAKSSITTSSEADRDTHTPQQGCNTLDHLKFTVGASWGGRAGFQTSTLSKSCQSSTWAANECPPSVQKTVLVQIQSGSNWQWD